MFVGACQCEAVRFEAAHVLPVGLHCHCSICRKIAGAAFASSVMIERDAFRLTHGEDQLAAYPSSPDFSRMHCRQCHAMVYGDTHHYPLWPLFVSAAALETRALEGVRFHHIFVGSKAPWFDITDACVQFEAAPPYLGSAAAPELSAWL